MATDIKQWFFDLPQFTRYWLAASVLLSIFGRYETLVLNFYLIFNQFEIWRLITSVFYYPIGFEWLYQLYFLVTYSQKLENACISVVFMINIVEFGGRPADYALFLFFNWICCLAGGLWLDRQFLMTAMVMSVMYAWCQQNKSVTVYFWFGTQFKAAHFPWVYWFVGVILGSDWQMDLIGILSAHLYLFLKFEYPRQHGGESFLKTPNFLKSWFPPRQGGWAGVTIIPPSYEEESPSTAGPTNYRFPGRGKVVGSSK